MGFPLTEAPPPQKNNLCPLSEPHLPRRRRRALSVLGPQPMLALCFWLLKGRTGQAVWPKTPGDRSQDPRDRWGRKPPPQPNTAQFLSALSSWPVQAAKRAVPQWGLTVAFGGAGGHIITSSPVIFPTQCRTPVRLGADSHPETSACKSQRCGQSWPAGCPAPAAAPMALGQGQEVPQSPQRDPVTVFVPWTPWYLGRPMALFPD